MSASLLSSALRAVVDFAARYRFLKRDLLFSNERRCLCMCGEDEDDLRSLVGTHFEEISRQMDMKRSIISVVLRPLNSLVQS